MTKVGSAHAFQSEKAIIDALLRISEIVQKTEASRQYHKSKRSKKTVGNGDYNDSYDDHEQQEVPVPPPMRTLESYVSGFNQNSSQNPSNCHQASAHRSTQLPSNQKHSHKRLCSDSSLRIATNFDDQSPSLNMLPIVSAATMLPPTSSNQTADRQQLSSITDSLTNPKADFNTSIDQELQATLENYLKNHFLSSTKITSEDIQKQRQTRLSSLTRSETEKLIYTLPLSQPISNSNHYDKQRELAMLAVKQGNYTLSYSIYTDLLHDYHYDYNFKSNILASRALTLLLEQKCFESIDDCTRAIAFNQWNKLAYIVRAACWMIKQEYGKAVEDYSKLFHFFDQSQNILDLLNLAYEKFQSQKNNTKPFTIDHRTRSLSLASPTASFLQPAVYLCYPYQGYPIRSKISDEQGDDVQQSFDLNNLSSSPRKSFQSIRSTVK